MKMEFSEISVKDSPGLCRCCLSEGCYKDMGTEYTWMNETEVYADMLLDCFDVGITQHNDGPNGPKRLICEVCITRLRDACNFKKQVLDSEKKFIDMLGRGEFRSKVLIYQDQLKSEAVEVSLDDMDTAAEVEYLDDIDFQPDDMEPLSTIKRELPSSSSTDAPRKRGRPRKDTTEPQEKKIKKTDVKKTKITKGERRGSQTAKQTEETSDLSTPVTLLTQDTSPARIPFKKPSKSALAKQKRSHMINNITEVLLKTTVMPFRWLKSSYRCFYCYEIFQEASDLKAHQIAHTSDEAKVKTINNYWEPLVYVDISNMTCKLCSENITDLFEMIDHLTTKHDVVYYKDFGECMVAFKLDTYNVSCSTCSANFLTFGPLLHHTNKYHKGTSAILCDACGKHFKDVNLLRLHVKSVHENIGLLCPECGDKFDSRSKLKTHQKNQHDLEKRHKCLVCTQTFASHYKRSRHMATEHSNRQEIKCLHCPKTFVFRSMMMTHLRDTHLKVRNHVCDICGWKAFNSNRLKNHMYKHSGEKNFKCDMCDKAFTTKKIMRAHFARMHKAPQQPLLQYNPYGQ